MTSIKRQKTSNHCSSDDPLELNLASLPAEIFNGITSYLTNTSCALLGVSLTAPSSSTLWRHVSSTFVELNLSTASAFILSSMTARGGDTRLDMNKDLLNERHLQEKIDDDDIHALLMFINAPEKLKRFKLGLLVNITGKGLEVLRGSRVIEQIRLDNYDMSLEEVLPILSSIIRTDGNSLKHIDICSPTRSSGQRGLLSNFVVEYNSLLFSRESACQNCKGRCERKDRVPWFKSNGRQKYTCSSCLQNCCTVRYCHECNEDLCVNCAVNWCNTCEECSRCIPHSTSWQTCESCGLKNCASCSLTCEYCNRTGCKSCLDFRECQGRQGTGCVIKSTAETASTMRSVMWWSAVKPIVMQVAGSVGIVL